MRNLILKAICLLCILVILSGCHYLLSEGPYLERAQREAKEYVTQHPKLDNRIKKLILDNKISTGMTKEQVRLSTYYQHPDNIEVTSKYGASEMWVYKRCWNRKVKPFKQGHRTVSVLSFLTYENLYFKDDTLIKIETIDTNKRCR